MSDGEPTEATPTPRKTTRNPIMALTDLPPESAASVGANRFTVEDDNVGFTKQDYINWQKGRTGKFLFVRKVCELETKETKKVTVREV